MSEFNEFDLLPEEGNQKLINIMKVFYRRYDDLCLEIERVEKEIQKWQSEVSKLIEMKLNQKLYYESTISNIKNYYKFKGIETPEDVYQLPLGIVSKTGEPGDREIEIVKANGIGLKVKLVDPITKTVTVGSKINSDE